MRMFLRQVAGSRLLLAAAPVLFLYFLFGCVLPFYFSDKIYSFYFSLTGDKDVLPTTKRAIALNEKRLEEANDYLEKVLKQQKVQKYKEAEMLKEESSPELVVTILTMDRELFEMEWLKLGYLNQTASSLHREIVRASFKKQQAFICNIDLLPTEHKDADSLKEFLPYKARFDREGDLDAMEKSNIFEKEKRDYTFCLLEAMAFNPKYVIMLEDDAVPIADFLKIVHQMLAVNMKELESDSQHDWLYMKLYYPEKWAGYSFLLRHYIELLGVFILGGFITFPIASLIGKCIFPHCHSSSYYYVLFLFCGIICVILVLVIGRPYVMELRRLSTFLYSLVPSPGCCTQAILYNAKHIKELVFYLTFKDCHIDYGIDLAIEDFAIEHNLQRHLVEPNLVKHIGLVSTMRQFAKRPAEFIF